MAMLGTTTLSHANDNAEGTTYNITNSNGFKLNFPNETVITVARALDALTLAAMQGTAPATETTQGIVTLASEADMNLITVEGTADTILDVVTVKQLQYWVNTVAPATINQNGFVKLAAAADLDRSSTSTGVISIGQLNDFLNDDGNQSTETRFGAVKLASVNNTTIGTDHTTAVTPLGAKSLIDQQIGRYIEENPIVNADVGVLGNVYLATAGEVIQGTINNNKAVIPSTAKAGFDSWINTWLSNSPATSPNDIPSKTEVDQQILDAIDAAVAAAVSQSKPYTDDVSVPVGGIIPMSTQAYYDDITDKDRWRICDGTNDTPNLKGRFLVGIDENDNDFQIASRVGGWKMIPHIHNVTIDETTLNWRQVPPHKHTGTYSGRLSVGNSGPAGYDMTSGTKNSGPDRADFDNTYHMTKSDIIDPNSPDGRTRQNSAQGHGHDGNCDTTNVSTLSPYYTVIYVMKAY